MNEESIQQIIQGIVVSSILLIIGVIIGTEREVSETNLT